MTDGRVRYGYAQENWLFFGTAGLAMMGTKPHINSIMSPNGILRCAQVQISNCSSSGIARGLAFGGSIEYGVTPNGTAKAKYLYIAQLQGATTQNINLFRVGLNTRFGVCPRREPAPAMRPSRIIREPCGASSKSTGPNRIDILCFVEVGNCD